MEDVGGVKGEAGAAPLSPTSPTPGVEEGSQRANADADEFNFHQRKFPVTFLCYFFHSGHLGSPWGPSPLRPRHWFFHPLEASWDYPEAQLRSD